MCIHIYIPYLAKKFFLFIYILKAIIGDFGMLELIERVGWWATIDSDIHKIMIFELVIYFHLFDKVKNGIILDFYNILVCTIDNKLNNFLNFYVRV